MRSTALCALALALLVAFALPRAGFAKEPFAVTFDGPYTSRAMVTGTRAENRPAGFADCLDDVLVKVSGNPHLEGDPRLKPYERKAGKLVVAFRYHDQLEGIPIHDEQGTRDRAFDLICDFKPAAIDKILHALGETPWKGPRPKLAVFVGVLTARGPFVLASDGERGIDQRLSFGTAANKRGFVAILPSTEVLTRRQIDFHKLDSPQPIRLDMAAKAAGGDLPLWGTLVWSDNPAGWKTQWRFAWHGHEYKWTGAGISFDEAFRRGFQGVAQILSGHGQPS
jgi:hypothetical protein